MTEGFCLLQGRAFSSTIIQMYAPTTNAKADEVQWLLDDQEDFLELTPKNKIKIK